MKRKLALLLAGCLAISPVSAGYFSAQAFAAEANSESGAESQYPAVITVKDENGTVLTRISEESETAEYNMTVGETRQLTALIGQDAQSPALSTWSSENSGILEIDDDGFITAHSAGTALIVLHISYDAEEPPAEFKYEIEISETAQTDSTAETIDPDQAPVAEETGSAEENTINETAENEDPVPEEAAEPAADVVVEAAVETDPAKAALQAA